MNEFFRRKINAYVLGFSLFVSSSKTLSFNEKESIHNDLQKKSILYILELSAIQLVWSVLILFLDIFLVSRMLVLIIQERGVYVAIVPLVLFHSINAITKYFFIKKYSKDKIALSSIDLLIAVIPSLGSFLLLGRLLYSKKVFLAELRIYSSLCFKRMLRGLF